jgi:hypothetical protein
MSKYRITQTPRPGFRHNGPRKHALLLRMDYMFTMLQKYGVDIKGLRKYLHLTRDPSTLTTKELTGMNSRIAEFVNEIKVRA